jgi:hypothetical protein
MEQNTQGAEWIKEVDFARAVENTVVGALLFFGRYFVTFAVFLRQPHRLESTLIFNSSYKNVERVDYVRPLSFLIVSGFAYLAFTLPTAGALIPIEGVLDELKGLVARLPHKVEDLTLAKIAAFMLPFVIFVALYALVSAKLFAALGMGSTSRCISTSPLIQPDALPSSPA